jgi:translation elongation factor EF-G
MNFQQDLQEMLDVQKQSILEAFQNQFSKLNERIDKLETSFNLQIQELKSQFGKSVEPAQLFEKKSTAEDDSKEDTTEEKRKIGRTVYDIMCLVCDKKPTSNDKNFESDSDFSEIIKKIKNDEKYSTSNGYNIYNRNLAICEDLWKRYVEQFNKLEYFKYHGRYSEDEDDDFANFDVQ